MAKPKGRHLTGKLTDKAIKAIKKPGRYGDGGGLYLVADNASAKRWIWRGVIQGNRTDAGLGSFGRVSLSEARDSAREYVKAARAGDDPRVTLRDTGGVPDFETAARGYHDQHKERWKNPKHQQQWINTLSDYAFPSIGKRPVDKITTPEIVALLSPIWFEKPETAKRVRQRIATILDDVKGKGHLNGENPVVGVAASLKVDKRTRPKHFKAMDYRDLPAFIQWLRSDDRSTMSRLALEFTILSAARTSETINATWTEIDNEKALWTIPADRMKMDREHRVPLSTRCLEILETVRPITESGGWIFEGQRPRKPMSNMAMLALLKRHNIPVTVHGFRSTFRDWCSEQTGFPYAAVERCLAHEPGNKVEAAYARSDLLDRRREIMDAWQAYALSKINDTENVVRLKTGA
jgi:integrase